MITNNKETYSITKANNLRYTQQYNKLSGQEYPDIQELASFLETEQPTGQAYNLRALKLKYQAMTTVPTTLERTMSPYQLYQSSNPLWVVELSADSIESFLVLETNVELGERTGKLSKLIFEQNYEYETQGPHLGTTDFSSYYPKILMEPKIVMDPKHFRVP